MELVKELYSKLDKRKIEINQNKNPIPMDLFMSFLTVKTEKILNHLGSSTGWTKFENIEHKLIVQGGICDGGHWLHYLEYGNKLQNAYNNYVSPFFLFDIMTDEGKRFFVKYYEKEIKDLVEKSKSDVSFLYNKLKEAKEINSKLIKETEKLFSI